MQASDEKGPSTLTRRSVLQAITAAPAVAALGSAMAQLTSTSGPTLALVSRHIQWTDWRTGLEVAREAGYPGIVWTVRPGAHVEPENVARDLPEIVQATRAAGLDVPMVITAIGNVRAPHAERILETFAELGIVRYRANAPRYDYERDFASQYDEMRRDLEALAALNAKYGTTACFHTHSAAGGVGGGGWDLWMLMKDLDPNHVGINFDIGHVTARNGNGWRDIAHAARTHIQSLSVKDVVAWQRNPAARPGDWPWRAEFVPPGEGMVDFDRFFSFFRATGFAGPVEVYHEYKAPIPGSDDVFDMLGTNYGRWTLEVPRDYFVSLLKRDVDFYKAAMRKAGFAVA